LLKGGNPSTLLDTVESLKANSPLRAVLKALIVTYGDKREAARSEWSTAPGGKWSTPPAVDADKVTAQLKSACLWKQASEYRGTIHALAILAGIDCAVDADTGKAMIKRARQACIKAGYTPDEASTLPDSHASFAFAGKLAETVLYGREYQEAVELNKVFDASFTLSAPIVNPTIDLDKHEAMLADVAEHNRTLHNQLVESRATLSTVTARADTLEGQLKQLQDMIAAGVSLKALKAHIAV
jgi:hypothetical protein